MHAHLIKSSLIYSQKKKKSVIYTGRAPELPQSNEAGLLGSHARTCSVCLHRSSISRVVCWSAAIVFTSGISRFTYPTLLCFVFARLRSSIFLMFDQIYRNSHQILSAAENCCFLCVPGGQTWGRLPAHVGSLGTLEGAQWIVLSVDLPPRPSIYSQPFGTLRVNGSKLGLPI